MLSFLSPVKILGSTWQVPYAYWENDDVCGIRNVLFSSVKIVLFSAHFIWSLVHKCGGGDSWTSCATQGEVHPSAILIKHTDSLSHP
jgi:hypothetical protein